MKASFRSLVGAIVACFALVFLAATSRAEDVIVSDFNVEAIFNRNHQLDAVEKVSAEIVKAVKEPEFGEQLKVLGIGIVGGNRGQLDAFRKTEDKRMGDIVKQANLDIK